MRRPPPTNTAAQVQLAAARLQALPASHPLLPGMSLALLNAANTLAFRALTTAGMGCPQRARALFHLLQGDGGGGGLEEVGALAQAILAGAATGTALVGPGSASQQQPADSAPESRAASLLGLLPDSPAAAGAGHLQLAAAQQLLYGEALRQLLLSATSAVGDAPAACGAVLGVLSVPQALLLLQVHPSGTLRLLVLQGLAFALLSSQRREPGSEEAGALPWGPLLCVLQNAASPASPALQRDSAQAVLGALLAAAAAAAASPACASAHAGPLDRVLGSAWHPKLVVDALGRACAVGSALLHCHEAGGSSGGDPASHGGGDGAAAVLQQPRAQQWVLLAGDLLFLTTALEATALAAPAGVPGGNRGAAEPAPAGPRRASKAQPRSRQGARGKPGRIAAAASDEAAEAPSAPPPPLEQQQAGVAHAVASAVARALQHQPLLGLLCKAVGGLAGGRAPDPGALLGALCAARVLRALLRRGLLDAYSGRALEALLEQLWETEQQQGPTPAGGSSGGWGCGPAAPGAGAGDAYLLGVHEGFESQGAWGSAAAAAAAATSTGDLSLGGGAGLRARLAAELAGLAASERMGPVVVGLLHPPLLLLAMAAAGEEDPAAGGASALLCGAEGVGGVSGWWGGAGSCGDRQRSSQSSGGGGDGGGVASAADRLQGILDCLLSGRA
jgi:hypothetical protein